MSIHNLKNDLRLILKDDYVIPKSGKIVALLSKDGKITEYAPKNYEESDLKNLVFTETLEHIKYDKVYVPEEYWNYNFCKEKNVLPADMDKYLLDFYFLDKDVRMKFIMGKILINISMMEILKNMYLIDNTKTFTNYLSKISFGKSVMRSFLKDMNMRLPLNDNYMILLKSIIQEEELDYYLISKDGLMKFTPEDLEFILAEFKIRNLDYISSKLFQSEELKKDKCKLLRYFLVILENTEINFSTSDVINFDPEDEYGFHFSILTLPEVEEDEQYGKLFHKILKKLNLKKENIHIKGLSKEADEIRRLIESNFEYLQV